MQRHTTSYSKGFPRRETQTKILLEMTVAFLQGARMTTRFFFCHLHRLIYGQAMGKERNVCMDQLFDLLAVSLTVACREC